MKTNITNWVWKWHLIGGLVTFPIIVILGITGAIYLFKDLYEAPRDQSFREVSVGPGPRLSYEAQWAKARAHWDKSMTSMVVPAEAHQATAFAAGKFSHKSEVFINPYDGSVTGEIILHDTDMYKIRKLHGELLTGRVGTKFVELTGCWLVVLLLSGIYLFIPRTRAAWRQLFRIHTKGARYLFFRDLHRVVGFVFSIVLLMILAGGLPWTDVWGDYFRWVQKQTGTGYPPTWYGNALQSHGQGNAIPLDQVVAYAEAQHLPGEVTITFPTSATGCFSIHNTYYPDLAQQVAIHLDQYTGEPLARARWADVGILMRGRMWFMAFHQGQFGFWNWLLVLVTALVLVVFSTAGVVAYFMRKQRGTWSIPKKQTYETSFSTIVIVGLLCALLPLFGVSVLMILAIELFQRKRQPVGA